MGVQKAGRLIVWKERALVLWRFAVSPRTPFPILEPMHAILARTPICTIVLLLLAYSYVTSQARASSVHVEQQRRDYLAAARALKSGDLETFHSLYARLDDYVLQSYLQYKFLKGRVSTTPKETIRGFLEQNRHAPISERLRRKWLLHLVKKEDWKTFIKEFPYNSDDPELRCHRLGYLLETDNDQVGLGPEIERLWLTSKRLPTACNPVFRRWREAGQMTPELVWARIERSMKRGRLSLARELGNYYLPAKERVWLRRWQEMYRNPARKLQKLTYPLDTPRALMIVKHGIVRLAYRDPEVAMEQWQRIRRDHALPPEAHHEVLRKVGMLAVQHHLPVAVQWLAEIPNADDDKALRTWRLRAALRAGEWELAKKFVATLTEDEQVDRFWWYWTARVMEQTGEPVKAGYLYALVALDRSYYGFLAADRVGADYAMQHEPIDAGPEEMNAMLARRDVQAARELLAVGDVVAARRQWGWALERMNKREREVAALAASDWGWHDRAIFALSKSDHSDDLVLRFPLMYKQIVETNAERHGLDPSWVYGVVRQESAFVVDARSSAGALGLMQLLPRIGRITSRQLKLKIRSKSAILKVENNLRLGTAFLKDMLRRHNGHQMLATAAYNAGTSRVRRWLPEQGTVDADVWVEGIPLDETRDYVKNVMAYTTVYDYRLARPPTRLCRRMPVVTPAKVDVVVNRECPQLNSAGST